MERKAGGTVTELSDRMPEWVPWDLGEILVVGPAVLSALALVVWVLIPSDGDIAENYIDFGGGRGVSPLITPALTFSLLTVPAGALIGWRDARGDPATRRVARTVFSGFAGAFMIGTTAFLGTLAGLIAVIVVGSLIGLLF